MRLLTTIPSKSKAESLVAFLLTRQISTHVESGRPDDHWEVWIRDEDRLDEAQRELASYLENPNDPRYVDAIRDAQQIIQEKRKQRLEASRNVKTGRALFRNGPGGPIGGGGIPPITLTLIVVASIVSLITNFMKPGDQNTFGKTMLDELQFVSTQDYLTHQLDPAASLKKGEIWRVITPMFPHGNTFHLLFNVLAIIQLGRIVERMEGTFRYAILVLLTGIFSSLLQGLLPLQFLGYPFFGGLSGVVYGVFGFLLVKSYLRTDLGIRLAQTSVIIMLGWLVLGFTGQMGPIANMAHLGGLLAGAFLGYLDAIQAKAIGKK